MTYELKHGRPARAGRFVIDPWQERVTVNKVARDIQKTLESELERLGNEVAVLEREGHEQLSEASGENNYRDHMADQGTATFSRELDMSLEENLKDSFGAVRAALDRMETGSYGVCESCGASIEIGRLQAMPTATLCITCKEAEESR
ncbi:MAG: TraR/DksA C4-type zinc finger protein [Actinomycetota bacterium]|nr:TraR/DksA C4-type zinc finger protein [Actinomycetota bacterium]